ncbi:MAG: hypothetical protein JSW47_19765, partial [Phycisphaerales bacterium]
ADFNIIGAGRLPAFTGTFDGGGHLISNFTYISADMRSAGIFGYVNDPDARISNLGLIDPNLDAGSAVAAGSLIGWLERGTVTDCYVVNCSIAGKSPVGGLVGSSYGIVENCHVTGNVEGLYSVGGLVGYNRRTVEECYSAGSVVGDGAVGGLIGNNNRGRIKGCSSTAGTTGRESVGGLVGVNSGFAVNGYSNSDVDGEEYVGGLVGRNDGLVLACCSYSRVDGAKEVGGLVGHNEFNGEIHNSYAAGEVIGQEAVGGLVGINISKIGTHGGLVYRMDKIRHCYTAAAISGKTEVGGLVGRDDNGGSTGCFWDIEASGQSTSAGGSGKTTAEMQSIETFLAAGWDFWGETGNGVDDIWTESPEGGYPILWWQLSPLPPLPVFSGGTGALDDPYLISTADELDDIGSNPRLMTAHFRLADDIDLAGVDFFSIASRCYTFDGTFDGNDHAISNFNYSAEDFDNVGLFGSLGNPDAEIRNLRLAGPTVVGRRFVGSLVGRLSAGSVTNCSVEGGTVKGEDQVGGLVGGISPDGIVTACSSNCGVNGQDDVGGLVGKNEGILMTSYSKASVVGRNAAGGLVGRNSPGEILNCYAAGEVAGHWYVGGLVGSNRDGIGGTILNCYSVTVVLEGHQSGGLVGANPPGDVRNSFWDIEASGIVSWGGMGRT